MSHTSTLKADIKDVRAIRSVVQELAKTNPEIKLLEKVPPRMYYATQHPQASDFVIKLPGRYDIGLDKGTDGKYTMVFDAWGGDIAKAIGDSRAKGGMATVAKFVQGYTKQAAINAAVARGYMVSGSTTNPKTGAVQLIINVPG